MKLGTLYGIGVGPGDPELITLKGAKILQGCAHVFVPKAQMGAESVALKIARAQINSDARIHELVFPMTADPKDLMAKWEESAAQVAAVLETSADACFLTLGDPFLYSTYIYLLRALIRRMPQVQVVTVPGIMAFSAAAAVALFPVGEGKNPVTIIPTADDLTAVRNALSTGGTIILMKIGKRLKDIIDLLEEFKVIKDSVFVSHVGMATQRIETDLRSLAHAEPQTGYLSIILIHGA